MREENDWSIGGAAEIRTILKRLEARLEADAEQGRVWRGLETLTNTMTSMGLFGVAAALPLISKAFQDTSWNSIGSYLVPGAFLVWLGVRFMLASVALRMHFSEQPAQLVEAWNLLQHGSLGDVVAWADESQDRSEIAEALRKARAAVKAGLWQAAAYAGVVAIGAMIIAYKVGAAFGGKWWGVLAVLTWTAAAAGAAWVAQGRPLRPWRLSQVPSRDTQEAEKPERSEPANVSTPEGTEM